MRLWSPARKLVVWAAVCAQAIVLIGFCACASAGNEARTAGDAKACHDTGSETQVSALSSCCCSQPTTLAEQADTGAILKGDAAGATLTPPLSTTIRTSRLEAPAGAKAVRRGSTPPSPPLRV